MVCENSSRSLIATTTVNLIEQSCSARHLEIVDLVAVAQMAIEAPMEDVVQRAIVLPKDEAQKDVVVPKVIDRQKVEDALTVNVVQKVDLVVHPRQIALRVVPLAEAMQKIVLAMKSLVKGTNRVRARSLRGSQNKSIRDAGVTFEMSFETLSSPAFLKSRAAFMNGG